MNFKKVLIVGISYNSNKALMKYLASIDHALSRCDNVEVTFVVGDNGTEEFKIPNRLYSFQISIKKYNNLGYLGAAFEILNGIQIIDYNFIIISNVDLEVDKDFFKNLENIDITCNEGWICPRVWSKVERRNRNPYMRDRNTKLKIRLLRFMYQNPPLLRIYRKTLYKRKKYSMKNAEESRLKIYAGHGSIFILTRKFFQKVKEKFEYPVFLYGEECYFGELCRKYDLEVIYEPSLRIETQDHVSTGSLNIKVYCEYNFKAMDFLLKNFY